MVVNVNALCCVRTSPQKLQVQTIETFTAGLRFGGEYPASPEMPRRAVRSPRFSRHHAN